MGDVGEYWREHREYKRSRPCTDPNECTYCKTWHGCNQHLVSCEDCGDKARSGMEWDMKSKSWVMPEKKKKRAKT